MTTEFPAHDRPARRRIAAAVLLAAVLAALPARAQPEDLYAVTVIVTGRDNLDERARGIREALPLVLTKVGADVGAAERAATGGLIDRAEEFVAGFDYRDRKEGIQISDEQGTRDRSFEFTVRFDPQRVDAALRDLGVRPWRGPRPAIGVALTVEDGVSRYLLTQESQKGYGQRAALADKAAALGLSVHLPRSADTALDQPVRLEGLMSVTATGHWDTHWQVTGDGVAERFAFSGTTFDVAIRDALRASAGALARR